MGANLSDLCDDEGELTDVCESMYVKDMPKKEIVALTEGQIEAIFSSYRDDRDVDQSYRAQIDGLYSNLSDTEPTSFPAFVGYTRCVIQVLRIAEKALQTQRQEKQRNGGNACRSETERTSACRSDTGSNEIRTLDETSLREWNMMTESTMPCLDYGCPSPPTKVSQAMMDQTIPIRDVWDDPPSRRNSSASNPKLDGTWDANSNAVLLMAGCSGLPDTSAADIVTRVKRQHMDCHDSGRPTIMFLLPESRLSTRVVEIRNKRLQVNFMLQEWAKQKPQILAVVDTGKLMPYDGGEFWTPDGCRMSALGIKVFYQRLQEDMGKATREITREGNSRGPTVAGQQVESLSAKLINNGAIDVTRLPDAQPWPVSPCSATLGGLQSPFGMRPALKSPAGNAALFPLAHANPVVTQRHTTSAAIGVHRHTTSPTITTMHRNSPTLSPVMRMSTLGIGITPERPVPFSAQGFIVETQSPELNAVPLVHGFVPQSVSPELNSAPLVHGFPQSAELTSVPVVHGFAQQAEASSAPVAHSFPQRPERPPQSAGTSIDHTLLPQDINRTRLPVQRDIDQTCLPVHLAMNSAAPRRSLGHGDELPAAQRDIDTTIFPMA